MSWISWCTRWGRPAGEGRGGKERGGEVHQEGAARGREAGRERVTAGEERGGEGQ